MLKTKKTAILLCSFYKVSDRMECWNVGILGIKAEINHFNCKKLLSFNFVQDKLTHHSIIPIGAKPLSS
jgi:hypothetical protein